MSYISLLESKGNSYAQDFKNAAIPIKILVFENDYPFDVVCKRIFSDAGQDNRTTHTPAMTHPSKNTYNIFFI